MSHSISQLDHVQLAIPVGGEPLALSFYVDLLGLTEVEKPSPLKERGGCWFISGSVKLHLGVEEDFRPARKVHPALLVSDLDSLEKKLFDQGHEVIPDNLIEGYRRFYSYDPFGNRLEFMESIDE